MARSRPARGALREPLLRFHDALDAFGRAGDMGWRSAEVPLADVVGSVSRAGDFDQEFRPASRALRDRRDGLANAIRAGFEPPSVTLMQLGELYFVIDGHHRVSVARSLGREVVDARVHRLCTVAFATCCLRAAHLASKAAERRFLERVPLPDEVRRDLWLDEPSAWMRLADAAEAWGLRWSLERSQRIDRCGAASAWWQEEVVPLVHRLRRSGLGATLRDIQLYTTALVVRDRLGRDRWPADLERHLA